MRLFVRVEDDRVLTLWMNDHTFVQDAKQAIVNSRRTSIPLDKMLLRSSEGIYMQDDRVMETYALATTKNQVFAVLHRHPDSHETIDYIRSIIYPPIDTSFIPLDCTIRIQLNQGFLLMASKDDEGMEKVLSLRGDRDQIAPGQVNYDASLHQLIFTPTALLHPNTLYSISILGKYFRIVSAETITPTIGNWYSCFRTIAKISDIRIMVTVINNEGLLARTSALITLSRTLSMLPQLRSAITTKFRLHDLKLDVKDMLTRGLDGSEELIMTDAHVYALLETNTITVTTMPMATSISLARPIYDHDTYIENNWVNDSSGYFAVCGKLTEEEENECLLHVVEAYALHEDNSDGIFADTTSTTIATTAEVIPTVIVKATASLRQEETPIPYNLLLHPINPLILPLLPSAYYTLTNNDPQLCLNQLRQSGYAYIRLPPTLLSLLHQAYSHLQTFFALPMNEKLECSHPLHRYLGYVNRTEYAKELFQLRRFNPTTTSSHHIASSLWRRTSSQFMRSVLDDLYTALHELASHLTAQLLREMGSSDEYVQSLLEPGGNTEALDHQCSTSNMTCFLYHSTTMPEQSNIHNIDGSNVDSSSSVSGRVHCPSHSDISLLSIIPPCQGQAGLQFFDWQEGQWVDVEQVKDVAVVCFGESMSRLTQNTLIPGYHNVTTYSQRESNDGSTYRMSIPFQFCARREATLDPHQLHALGIDPSTASREDGGPVNAGYFMDTLSSSRISSNFPPHTRR